MVGVALSSFRAKGGSFLVLSKSRNLILFLFAVLFLAAFFGYYHYMSLKRDISMCLMWKFSTLIYLYIYIVGDKIVCLMRRVILFL